MVDFKKIGMAAGTFSVALGIGFVMQNGDALASRFGSEGVEGPVRFAQDVAPVETVQANLASDFSIAPKDAALDVGPNMPVVSPVIEAPAPIVEIAVTLPNVTQVPETTEAPVQLASIDPEALPEFETPLPNGLDTPPTNPIDGMPTETAEVNCVPTMAAVAGPTATVELAIAALCHTDTAFVVHHQGMLFSAMTDENGEATLIVPALAEMAVMIAAFENGNSALATVAVPEFGNFERAVLQWQGDTGVMLSAYENGAGFASEGHIFLDNPGDISRAEAGIGGYLLSLGNSDIENAMMAEVYTYPAGVKAAGGSVTLVAEAEITAANCGNELNAQSIQVEPTGNASALDLMMVMPDCDAVGDFLILQNMFQDLTLASR